MKRLLLLGLRILWKSNSIQKYANPFRKLYFRISGDMPKEQYVSLGETVLHAGCWQIETVRNWSQSVGSKGKVIIIEADDYSYELLTKELELRKTKLNNVFLVHKAVWNKKDKLTLEEADGRPGSNKIKETRTHYETNLGNYINEISVDADTITNILGELKIDHVDHFHVTINGAELEALEGIDRKYFKKGTRIIIFCETLITDTNEAVRDRVIEQLKDYGFKVYFKINMPKHPDIIYGIV
jgi:FkbM family methyltransferase